MRAAALSTRRGGRADLLATVDEALKPEHVRLWLRDGQEEART